MPLSKEKKIAYFEKLDTLMNQYSRLFIVSADNVGSAQMAQIRKSLRGKAEVLMGKNTMMRRGFRNFLAKNPGHPFEQLMPYIQGNIGFVFTDSDLIEVRDIILSSVVPAPARVGVNSPVDVFVPPGPTGCDPGQTSFFQVLDIATKISRGQIEIVSEVHLLAVGDRVEPGHAALLKKLNLLPFSYGLKIVTVYENGSIFSPAVLSLTEDDMANKFIKAASKVAALGLALGMPTLASLRYSIAGAFAKVLALSLATGVACPQTQLYLDYLADPSKFAAATAAPSDAAPAAAAEVEEEPEEADVGAGGLFGDDGDDY